MKPRIILTLLLTLALLGVSISAASCTTANQTSCGSTLLGCQGYVWVNGTCLLGTCPNNTYWSNSSSTCVNYTNGTCPSNTYWSNSTAACVACSSANQDTCSFSCMTYGYFYSSQYAQCQNCPTAYGANCATCNSSQCLICASGYSVSADGSGCVSPTCNVPNCLACSSTTVCQTCQSGFILNTGKCFCGLTNC